MNRFGVRLLVPVAALGLLLPGCASSSVSDTSSSSAATGATASAASSQIPPGGFVPLGEKVSMRSPDGTLAVDVVVSKWNPDVTGSTVTPRAGTVRAQAEFSFANPSTTPYAVSTKQVRAVDMDGQRYDALLPEQVVTVPANTSLGSPDARGLTVGFDLPKQVRVGWVEFSLPDGTPTTLWVIPA